MNKSRLAGVLSACLGLLLMFASGGAIAQFNQPPVADAGPDQFVMPLDFVTLDGSASFDPEFLPMTFSWTQLLGELVNLSSAAAEMPTFTAPATDQLLRFQLEVFDFEGLPSTDTVDIHVSSVPVPAAIWLFGSGLIGMVGMARRRKAT